MAVKEFAVEIVLKINLDNHLAAHCRRPVRCSRKHLWRKMMQTFAFIADRASIQSIRAVDCHGHGTLSLMFFSVMRRSASPGNRRRDGCVHFQLAPFQGFIE
jgi:hypothetical protein